MFGLFRCWAHGNTGSCEWPIRDLSPVLYFDDLDTSFVALSESGMYVRCTLKGTLLPTFSGHSVGVSGVYCARFGFLSSCTDRHPGRQA